MAITFNKHKCNILLGTCYFLSEGNDIGKTVYHMMKYPSLFYINCKKIGQVYGWFSKLWDETRNWVAQKRKTILDVHKMRVNF